MKSLVRWPLLDYKMIVPVLAVQRDVYRIIPDGQSRTFHLASPEGRQPTH